MIHFLYLLGFAALVGTAFGVFSNGETKQKTLYGLKIFTQFLVVSLVLAWIFYFIPW